MFRFLCRFTFFINFSSFKPDTEQANTATLMLFSKGDKILMKKLYECKGCNAWHLITKFLNKGWTKNSINRLMVKFGFGTVDRRPGSGRRSACTDENVDTVESLLLSQEDKPQSHQTVRKISREVGGSIDHHFRGLFIKICVSSAARKDALNS